MNFSTFLYHSNNNDHLQSNVLVVTERCLIKMYYKERLLLH